MSYTLAALIGVIGAIALDRLLGTDLLRRKAFWTTYAIVLFFQLIVNGLLTGLEIVRYDPDQILGPRLVFAPVEDLLFGFAMVTATLTLWVWAGRRDARRGSGPARRATGPTRRPGNR